MSSFFNRYDFVKKYNRRKVYNPDNEQQFYGGFGGKPFNPDITDRTLDKDRIANWNEKIKWNFDQHNDYWGNDPVYVNRPGPNILPPNNAIASITPARKKRRVKARTAIEKNYVRSRVDENGDIIINDRVPVESRSRNKLINTHPNRLKNAIEKQVDQAMEHKYKMFENKMADKFKVEFNKKSDLFYNKLNTKFNSEITKSFLNNKVNLDQRPNINKEAATMYMDMLDPVKINKALREFAQTHFSTKNMNKYMGNIGISANKYRNKQINSTEFLTDILINYGNMITEEGKDRANNIRKDVAGIKSDIYRKIGDHTVRLDSYNDTLQKLKDNINDIIYDHEAANMVLEELDFLESTKRNVTFDDVMNVIDTYDALSPQLQITKHVAAFLGEETDRKIKNNYGRKFDNYGEQIRNIFNDIANLKNDYFSKGKNELNEQQFNKLVKFLNVDKSEFIYDTLDRIINDVSNINTNMTSSTEYFTNQYQNLTNDINKVTNNLNAKIDESIKNAIQNINIQFDKELVEELNKTRAYVKLRLNNVADTIDITDLVEKIIERNNQKDNLFYGDIMSVVQNINDHMINYGNSVENLKTDIEILKERLDKISNSPDINLSEIIRLQNNINSQEKRLRALEGKSFIDKDSSNFINDLFNTEGNLKVKDLFFSNMLDRYMNSQNIKRSQFINVIKQLVGLNDFITKNEYDEIKKSIQVINDENVKNRNNYELIKHLNDKMNNVQQRISADKIISREEVNNQFDLFNTTINLITEKLNKLNNFVKINSSNTRRTTENIKELLADQKRRLGIVESNNVDEKNQEILKQIKEIKGLLDQSVTNNKFDDLVKNFNEVAKAVRTLLDGEEFAIQHGDPIDDHDFTSRANLLKSLVFEQSKKNKITNGMKPLQTITVTDQHINRNEFKNILMDLLEKDPNVIRLAYDTVYTALSEGGDVFNINKDQVMYLKNALFNSVQNNILSKPAYTTKKDNSKYIAEFWRNVLEPYEIYGKNIVKDFNNRYNEFNMKQKHGLISSQFLYQTLFNHIKNIYDEKFKDKPINYYNIPLLEYVLQSHKYLNNNEDPQFAEFKAIYPINMMDQMRIAEPALYNKFKETIPPNVIKGINDYFLIDPWKGIDSNDAELHQLRQKKFKELNEFIDKWLNMPEGLTDQIILYNTDPKDFIFVPKTKLLTDAKIDNFFKDYVKNDTNAFDYFYSNLFEKPIRIPKGYFHDEVIPAINRYKSIPTTSDVLPLHNLYFNVGNNKYMSEDQYKHLIKLRNKELPIIMHEDYIPKTISLHNYNDDATIELDNEVVNERKENKKRHYEQRKLVVHNNNNGNHSMFNRPIEEILPPSIPDKKIPKRAKRGVRNFVGEFDNNYYAMTEKFDELTPEQEKEILEELKKGK